MTDKQAVRDDLMMQINALATDLGTLHGEAIGFAAHQIQRAASAHQFVPLAALAKGLEQAMKQSTGVTIIGPYLEAMRDAAFCESMDPSVASRYLAAVSNRLNG